MKKVSKKNKKNIFYAIANILYILATVSCVYMYPKMIEIGFLGLLFLVVYIVYSIFVFGFILLKKDKDIICNIVKIIIYCYLIFIGYKYSILVNNNLYTVSDLYFKVNFLVCSISLMGIIFNGLLSSKNE